MPQPELLVCSDCNGSTFVKAVSGVLTLGDEKVGDGVEELLCVQCLIEGKLTTV